MYVSNERVNKKIKKPPKKPLNGTWDYKRKPSDTLQISTKPSQPIIMIYSQKDVISDTLYLLIQPLNTSAQFMSHCADVVSCVLCDIILHGKSSPHHYHPRGSDQSDPPQNTNNSKLHYVLLSMTTRH